MPSSQQKENFLCERVLLLINPSSTKNTVQKKRFPSKQRHTKFRLDIFSQVVRVDSL
jgi:hypothetical protein